MPVTSISIPSAEPIEEAPTIRPLTLLKLLPGSLTLNENPPPISAKRPRRSRRCSFTRARRAASELPPRPSKPAVIESPSPV